MLVVDDAHLGGRPLELTRRTLADRLPVLVVVLARTDLPEHAPILADATRVLLAPLGPGDAEQHAIRMLPLEGGVAATLAKRSGGNPGLAEQLAARWLESGLLGWRDGRFELQAEPPPTDLSAVWSERVAAALERAPGAGRAVALAAALGPEVDLATWQRTAARLGVDPDPEVFAHLARRGLVVLEPGRVRFAHGLVREAAVLCGGAPEPLHLACAEELAASGAAVTARRGHHLLSGGCPADAADVLLDVAQAALDAGRLRELAEVTELAEGALRAAEAARAARSRTGRLRGRRARTRRSGRR